MRLPASNVVPLLAVGQDFNRAFRKDRGTVLAAVFIIGKVEYCPQHPHGQVCLGLGGDACMDVDNNPAVNVLERLIHKLLKVVAYHALLIAPQRGHVEFTGAFDQD